MRAAVVVAARGVSAALRHGDASVGGGEAEQGDGRAGFDASTDSRIIIQLWQNSGNVAPIILHYVLQ